jgi:hypothetical protein
MKREITKYAKSIEVPVGYVVEQEVIKAHSQCGGWPEFDSLRVGLKSEHVRIEFRIYPPSQWTRNRTKGLTFQFDGTTEFKADVAGKSSWFTFDRLGVDTSFYGDNLKTPDPNVVIREQIERSLQAIERKKSQVPVPGFPQFLRTPEQLDNMRLEWLGGRVVRLMPSGFGIGYSIQRKRTSWCEPAPRELDNFVGIPLWVERMDCD